MKRIYRSPLAFSGLAPLRHRQSEGRTVVIAMR
jgi:hypothetical protein